MKSENIMDKSVNTVGNKHFSHLFFLLALLCAFFAVCFFAANSYLENTLLKRTKPLVFSEGWALEAQPENIALSEPSRPASDSIGKTLRLVNLLPETLPDNMSLFFQTKNETVRVYVDGINVYTYAETPQRVYGHGVGSVWNIASLPDDAGGKTIVVELTPIGERTGLAPYRFLIASRNDAISYLLWENATLIVVSILLALIGLIGIATFILWASRHNGIYRFGRSVSHRLLCEQ